MTALVQLRRPSLPQHLSKSAEWGTPPDLVERARRVLDGIDLDPASSVEHNRVVQASRFYTAEQDGLKQDWYGGILLNPPGDKSGQLVKRFWEKAVDSLVSGDVHGLIWIGFSLNQLQQLQHSKVGSSPIAWPTCIFKKRVKYLKGGEPQSNPPHGTYVSLIARPGTRAWERKLHERFRAEFKGVGQLVNSHE